MSAAAISRESMIQAGAFIQQRVSQLRDRARSLYYAVMLFQKECRSCGSTTLVMEQDACCHCRACGNRFDPTLEFQSCPDCDHPLVLKVCHYWCPHCQQPVRSLFCFDERVFDPAYFREMMRTSRQRKVEQADKLRRLLLDSRSAPCWPDTPPTLEELPGFADDLAPFVAALAQPMETVRWVRPYFDMAAYRRHLLDRVTGCVVEFEGVSAVIDDPRLDRVYRFITAVFLEHEGALVLRQSHDGRITLVGA